MILPRPGREGLSYRLAWDLTLPVDRAPREIAAPRGAGGIEGQEGSPAKEMLPVQWRYFVDAETGAVIERQNLMRYQEVSGTVTGMVHPEFPSDTPVEEPLANLTVPFSQGTTVSDETAAAGDYLISGLLGGVPGTLAAYLEGPHIRVWNQETPDPDATHTASLEPPANHSWSWSADDPSPGQVETSAFYQINLIRDWFLRGAPFDVSPEPDPLGVHVRDGAYCNASAGPSGLYFASGILGTCEDYALCADIVYHEYTHRIVHKVYDDAGVSLPYSGQTGAMNEAWADYFGNSITGSPAGRRARPAPAIAGTAPPPSAISTVTATSRW